MNSAFAKKDSDIHPPDPELCVDLIHLCSNTVQLFQEVERVKIYRTLAFYRHSFPHCAGYESRPRRCTPMCYFRPMIRRSLLLIHESRLTLRLNTDSWKKVVPALEQPAVITESSPSYYPNWEGWTSAAHRNGMQRSVLETFHRCSPDVPDMPIHFIPP